MAKATPQVQQLPVAAASTSYSLGTAAVLALTAVFLWLAPAANGPAALALGTSILLDALSRLAADAAARRSGVGLAMRGLPSLVLPLGGAPAFAAAILATLPLVGPGLFPVVASLIAGLVAMGALARLSLARHVVAHAEAEARGARHGAGTGP